MIALFDRSATAAARRSLWLGIIECAGPYTMATRSCLYGGTGAPGAGKTMILARCGVADTPWSKRRA